MSTRIRVWSIRFGAAIIIAAPWLERVLDRIGHALDLGCLGLH